METTDTEARLTETARKQGYKVESPWIAMPNGNLLCHASDVEREGIILWAYPFNKSEWMVTVYSWVKDFKA